MPNASDLLDLTLLQPVHIQMDAICREQWLVNRRQAEWSQVPELRMSITFPQRARVAEFHFRDVCICDL